MKTIKFYNEKNRYMGWKKLKNFQTNWLECKSWINSGNTLIINGEKIESWQVGKLHACLCDV
jgi:hypothetical protein